MRALWNGLSAVGKAIATAIGILLLLMLCVVIVVLGTSAAPARTGNTVGQAVAPTAVIVKQTVEVPVTRVVTQLVSQTQVVEKQVTQIVMITATPVPVTATPTSTSTPTPDAIKTAVQGDFKLDYTMKWYQSPFTATTDFLTDTATRETFAEPGVLLDNTAAFDHMSAVDTPILVPEGGDAYVAIGGMTVSHNGKSLLLPYLDRNIYLVLFRGFPDDGTPTDLNQVVLAFNYVRSAGIYSPINAGAYVSLGWWIQQIRASLGSPNCGMSCEKITTIVIDLKTHTYRVWTITDPKNLRNWIRLQP